MISCGAKWDNTYTSNGAGVYTMRSQGEIHHRIGSLLPGEGEQPEYVQVYMYEGDDGTDAPARCDAGAKWIEMLLLSGMNSEF
jgi:hypothetical protein